MFWKCLDYSKEELQKSSDAQLKAMMLAEWASCCLEKPPQEFGRFSVDVVAEMKKRKIDHTKYMG